MSAVLRGNLAMACAQFNSMSSGHKLFPGCLNVSHDKADDGKDGGGGSGSSSGGGGSNNNYNHSSPSYNAVCDDYTSTLGQTGDYLVGFALLCIIATAIVMNSFVIWSFAVRRKTIVSVDYYILTLAISDLCSPVFAYPLAMISTFAHRWIFGDTGCLINGFLGFFFGIVDIFVLSTLSFTRYLCVCHPMAFSHLTKAKVLLSLLGVLLMSSLWAVLPVLGWGAYGVEPFGTSCTLQWSTPDRSYVTSVFLSCLVLPLMVMSLSYGCILYDTRSASRRLRKYNSDGQKQYRRAKHEMRLIKITILMTACFLLAWLPYAIVSMMSAYLPEVQVTGPSSIVPTLLAKTSHLSNPVIYFTMNSRFSHRSPCCPVPLPLPQPFRSRALSGSSDSCKSVVHLQEDVRLEMLKGRARHLKKVETTVVLAGQEQGRNCTVTSSLPNSPWFGRGRHPTFGSEDLKESPEHSVET